MYYGEDFGIFLIVFSKNDLTQEISIFLQNTLKFSRISLNFQSRIIDHTDFPSINLLQNIRAQPHTSTIRFKIDFKQRQLVFTIKL